MFPVPCLRASLLIALSLLTPTASAQEKQKALSAAQVLEVQVRARRLRTARTDWVLFRDVCDKIRAIGPVAIPVLQKEIKEPGIEDFRLHIKYVVRLGRILAELDPDWDAAEIIAALSVDDLSVASFAARVMGRTRVKSSDVAEILIDAYRDKRHAPIRSALLCAMADCGHPSLFPFIEELLLEKKIQKNSPGDLHRYAQLALAICSTKKHLPKARKWLELEEGPRLAGILMAKKFRDAKCEEALIQICKGWDKPYKEQALQALAALAGEEGKAFVTKMRKDRVSDPNDDSGSGVVVMMSSEVDPALLALLRLGLPVGLDWAEDTVKQTGQFSMPNLTKIPRLVGSWGLPGAKAMLARWSKFKNLKGWGSPEGQYGATRVSIGTAYCYLKDSQGLSTLSDILLDPAYQANGAMGRHVLQSAQTALHEFVGNADRPEYVAISMFPSDDEKGPDPVQLGKSWEGWLTKTKDKIQWRKPALNLMSTLEIY